VVTNTENCSSESAKTAITVLPTPAQYDPSPSGATNFCEGGSVVLKTNYTTADLTKYNLQWLNEGKQVDNETGRNLTVKQNGNIR
jgi:hypothetical protein